MKESPATTSATTRTTPAGNPMNLTCTTAPSTTSTSSGTPSEIMVVIFNNGTPPPPPSGWNTFMPADANAQYTVDLNGNSQIMNGAGVAIYYK